MLSLSGLGPSQSCQPPRGCGPARLGGAPEGGGLASGPSLPTADTLRELVSSGIQALVQEIKERFTSSLVSVGPRTRPPPPSPARPVAKSTSPTRASAGGRCVFWGHLLPVLHLSLRAAVSFQRQATDTCCELRRAHPSSPLPGAGLLRREGAAEPGGGQAALLCPGAACCGPRKPGPPDPHPLPGAVRPAAWGCPLTGLFLRGGGAAAGCVSVQPSAPLGQRLCWIPPFQNVLSEDSGSPAPPPVKPHSRPSCPQLLDL